MSSAAILSMVAEAPDETLVKVPAGQMLVVRLYGVDDYHVATPDETVTQEMLDGGTLVPFCAAKATVILNGMRLGPDQVLIHRLKPHSAYVFNFAGERVEMCSLLSGKLVRRDRESVQEACNALAT